MSALTILDLNTTVNHEPRIHDLRLAEFLGFTRPRDIRKLIERHKDVLERFGSTCAKRRKSRGQDFVEYYLNKKQCTYICAKSDTEVAAEKTIEVVEVYDAYTSGTLPLHAPIPKALPAAEEEVKGAAAIVRLCEKSLLVLHEMRVPTESLRFDINAVKKSLETITDLCGQPRRVIPAQVVSAQHAAILKGGKA
jgi:hypothetical protein